MERSSPVQDFHLKARAHAGRTDRVERDGAFYTVEGLQLKVLDIGAARFEHEVQPFNAPPIGIPLDHLSHVVEGLDQERGEQQPTHRRGSLGGIDFVRPHRRDGDGTQGLLGKRRPLQLDGPVQYGKKAAGGSYAGRLVVYGDTAHADPWFLLTSVGLENRSWGEIVAAYGQRFTCEASYKDQKNDPGAGFHLDCVKLGTAERWDRLWLVFAWAYYWLNVAGWDAEVRGTARQWRANTVNTRTHALWRLGLWVLTHGGLSWRTIYRRHAHFTQEIPPVGTTLAPT